MGEEPDLRVVLTAWFSDASDSRRLTKHLRRHHWQAVDGPMSAGHAVAWHRRNAAIPIDAAGEWSVCLPWTHNRSVTGNHIVIEPGSGFGHGGHPTTLLVLRMLQARLLNGKRVLDVGCGTGILAIAAARWGATSVALDIAPAAIAATENNARRNGVSNEVEIVDADLERERRSFDVVAANIHAPILMELSATLRRLTAPEGSLLLSGLSPAQVSVVAAAMSPLVLVDQHRMQDWVALEFSAAQIA